jgi:NAD(P)-dependent dehydrogenase (short-subunit alcohol dehydrogenase family)
MMNRLQGKVAVITGGTSGIGLATAKAFLGEGARVVVVGRDQEKVDRAKDLLGGGAVAVRADVSKLGDLDALFARVRDEFERVDVLFANAGIPGASLPIEKMTSEEFDAIFATNVRGTFFTVQKAIPLLGNGASVILTTSIANQLGRANVSAYACSKAAVRSLTQSFAAELIGRGVRVNAISPGGTDTGIIAKRFSPEKAKAVMERLKTTLPIKRLAQPEEIANVALFLASDESSFVLGEELVADGGVSRFTSLF